VIRDVVRYQPPQHWGVLFIDCWHVGGQNDVFYQTVVDRLRYFSVSATVCCTVDLKIDYSDVSVYNTLNRYLWNPDSVSEHVNRNVLLDLISSAGNQETSRLLRTNIFNNDTVCLYRRETFNHHAQYHCEGIKDWIVVGSAWKMCVHHGPLGIDRLVDIGDHKFHIFPEWSIQTEHREPPSQQDIHDDFYVWAPIADGGYRLITRAQNHKWFENKTT
jgi:hypothetical protein